MLLGEFGNLVRSVLRIIATRVEEVADVVSLENLEHALEILLFLEFVTASAQSSAGGVAKTADGLLRLGGEVDQVFLKDAKDTVEAAVNFFDATVVQGFGDDARHTGVDDGGGATGLAHQNISYEFSHGSCCDIRLESNVRDQRSGTHGAVANPNFRNSCPSRTQRFD